MRTFVWLVVLLSVSVVLADRPMLVVTGSANIRQLRGVRAAVERAGGRVVAMLPPHSIIVHLNERQASTVSSIPLVKRLARGQIKKTDRLWRVPGTKRVLDGWNAMIDKRGRPLRMAPIPDGVLGKDALVAKDVPAAAPPGARPPGQMTPYACGDCVVTIFLTESDGSLEQSTENWTASEEAQVTAEVQEGLIWFADYMNQRCNANLTFILEWHYKEPTKYEPIKTNAKFPAGNAAAHEIMQRFGYFESLSGGRLFNDAQRLKYGADMAFTVFVADSSADGDGVFADGYIAYAYLGGPWMVQNLKNNGWGIDRMNRVTAHEAGHIFNALDEYSGSGALATHQMGYLNVLNANAVDGGGAGNPCLMLGNSLTMCKWTVGHLGGVLPNTTFSGTPDVLRYERGGVDLKDQLALLSHQVTDDGEGGDGDGKMEGGEVISLSVVVKNTAFVKMRQVSGTLSCGSPLITFVRDQSSFGDVADYDGEAAAAEPFILAIDTVDVAQVIPLTLSLSTAQGWSFSGQIDLSVEPGGDANRTPRLALVKPTAGQVLDLGDTLDMDAFAADPEDGWLSNSIKWTSSLQGVLGTGERPSVVLLAAGTHQVVATVVDSGGKSATASASVEVLGQQIEQVVDDGEQAYQETGVGWKPGTWPGGYQGDYRFLRRTDGAGTGTWTFGPLPAGQYRVYCFYVHGHTRSNKAPFSILDGNTVLTTVLVNQKAPPSGFAWGGKQWRGLGTHSISSGTLKVRLANASDATVIADSVLIVRE